MICIDPQIKLCRAQAGDWRCRGFRNCLRQLANLEFALVIDWDEGAGEEWASILSAKQKVAVVSRAIPFAISQALWTGVIERAAPALTVISVLDLEDDCLQASEQLLLKCLNLDALSGQLDMSRFSAETLWWATI